MNELMTADNFNLERATNAVVELKKDVGKGIIALGQWLAIVKDNLPGTEYLNWLRYEVDITNFMASRFMHVSKEIDYKTLEKLGPKRVYEILELPESQFKRQLIQEAKELSDDEVKERMQKFKEANTTEQKELEGTPERETIVRIPTDIDMALRDNARFLDHLVKVNLDNIPNNFVSLVRNQLLKNINFVTNFLKELPYVEE